MPFHPCLEHWEVAARTMRQELEQLRMKVPNPVAPGWARVHLADSETYLRLCPAYFALGRCLGRDDPEGTTGWIGGGLRLDATTAANAAEAFVEGLNEDSGAAEHAASGPPWLAVSPPVPPAAVLAATRTYFALRDALDERT